MTDSNLPNEPDISNLPKNLLITFRKFYAECVKKGTIPVKASNGWYRSSSKQHFNQFLSKFSAEDKAYITAGIKKPSAKESATSRIALLIAQMKEDEVRLILEEIK